MRRHSALLLLALLTGACAQAAEDDLDRVMQLLGTRRHGEVEFVEQHFLSLLKRPAESSGVLIYDAPDRLEKRTDEPRAESLVLNGSVLTVRHGQRAHALDMKSYPQILPFVESIRATLAGDRGALERVFRVGFTGDVARWVLELQPLDAGLAGTVAEVRIEGSGDDLRRVEILQPDGDRSVMTLRNRKSR